MSGSKNSSSLDGPVIALLLASAASYACSSSSAPTSAPADGGNGGVADASNSNLDAGGQPAAEASSGDGEPGSDDGPSRCGATSLPDGGSCTGVAPTSATILDTTFSSSGGVVFGATPNLWDAYPLASPGQALPTITPAAASVSLSAALSAPLSFAGVGISTDSGQCVDATSYLGIQFTLSGDIGFCTLVVDSIASDDEAATEDPCRGACTASSTGCVAPSTVVSKTGPVTLPFMSFTGGAPTYAPETKQLIGFRWRLVAPAEDAGGSCSANLTIADLQFIQ